MPPFSPVPITRIRILENNKDEFVRNAATSALGKIGDESVIPYLKKSLKDDAGLFGYKVKDAAYEALEMIGKRMQMRILLENVGARRKQ